MTACPEHIAELRKAFVIDEVVSGVRHDLANKLASIRNASFYLKRQVENRSDLWTADARIRQFFGLIEGELEASAELMRPQLPSPEGAAAAGAGADPVRAVTTLLQVIERPRGVTVEGPGTGPGRLGGDDREIQLAVFCFIENAFEAVRRAGGGRIGVECVRLSATDGAVRVSDDGPGLQGEAATRATERFFSTTPGKLGVGLNVAARVARRWNGRIEIAPGRTAGTTATLVLPLTTEPR
jgi:signal transduction histidine kinase